MITPRRTRPLWLIALVLISSSTGCFAPSYLAPEQPYSRSQRAILEKTYFAAYDVTVALQSIPLPLCYVCGWEKESLGRDITMSCAAPGAVVGMIALGSLALPFVGVFRKA